MKTSELYQSVAKEAEITRPQATAALKSALKTIGETVQAGTPVSIKGVGRFRLSKPRKDGTSTIVYKPAEAGEQAETTADEPTA